MASPAAHWSIIVSVSISGRDSRIISSSRIIATIWSGIVRPSCTKKLVNIFAQKYKFLTKKVGKIGQKSHFLYRKIKKFGKKSHIKYERLVKNCIFACLLLVIKKYESFTKNKKVWPKIDFFTKKNMKVWRKIAFLLSQKYESLSKNQKKNMKICPKIAFFLVDFFVTNLHKPR